MYIVHKNKKKTNIRRQQGGQHELITLKQFNKILYCIETIALNLSIPFATKQKEQNKVQPTYNKCSDYALKHRKVEE